eukprot:CAMPEP_0196744076 /NCGR_PEP_ID=MMETSP1091-20130531/55871_1 /TAXON_ID=302021 /ORGANISM="Rhodomonas sp., Strain CCMP768" /LENGTH=34 /DNA_ID= /DNA_START= /DNA_END= /DNA_ORIENTATION=
MNLVSRSVPIAPASSSRSTLPQPSVGGDPITHTT